MTIVPEITKIAGKAVKNGSYYELQELVQRDKETGEVVPHYDGEISWFRIMVVLPNGMPDGCKEFGPDMNKAYKYLKNRR